MSYYTATHSSPSTAQFTACVLNHLVYNILFNAISHVSVMKVMNILENNINIYLPMQLLNWYHFIQILEHFCYWTLPYKTIKKICFRTVGSSNVS